MEQDFLKFMEKLSHSSSGSTPDIQEVVDLYISQGGESSYNTSPLSYVDQLTVSLDDFDEFEKTLSNPKEEPYPCIPNGAGLGIDLEETEIMINEMAENGSLSPLSGAVLPENMDSYEGLNYQSQTVYVKYGDLESYGAGFGEMDVVLEGLLGPHTGDSIAMRGCWMNLRKRKKGDKKADASTTRGRTRRNRDRKEQAN